MTPTPTSTSTSTSTIHPGTMAAHPEPFDSAALERGYAQDRPRAAGPESRRPPLLAALLLALPGAAAAVPANRSIALEGVLSGQAGAASPAATLSAGCWLEWELEAQAHLTVGAAPRPEIGRAHV